MIGLSSTCHHWLCYPLSLLFLTKVILKSGDHCVNIRLTKLLSYSNCNWTFKFSIKEYFFNLYFSLCFIQLQEEHQISVIEMSERGSNPVERKSSSVINFKIWLFWYFYFFNLFDFFEHSSRNPTKPLIPKCDNLLV